jgi:hypothetical protein
MALTQSLLIIGESRPLDKRGSSISLSSLVDSAKGNNGANIKTVRISSVYRFMLRGPYLVN